MKWAEKRVTGTWTRLGPQVDPITRVWVERSVLVVGSSILERKKNKKKRKERVVRNVKEGMKDGVPVAVRLVGIAELRNLFGASNVNQETGSKLVRGGRSNRVRIGDGKGSKFKTICTKRMPPMTHYGVQSNLTVQTPHDVSFLFVP